MIDFGGFDRTGVWRLKHGGSDLICEEVYNRGSDGHTQGTTLDCHDFAGLFEALAAGNEILLGRTEPAPRTAELNQICLHPSGGTALMRLTRTSGA